MVTAVKRVVHVWVAPDLCTRAKTRYVRGGTVEDLPGASPRRRVHTQAQVLKIGVPLVGVLEHFAKGVIMIHGVSLCKYETLGEVTCIVIVQYES